MSSAARRTIHREDILSLEDYERVRSERRTAIRAMKRQRRLEVGPFASFSFENYDTLWLQIHEMLRIEKGGESQIADELAAYAPLVPNGSELVATVMLEIEDATHRTQWLSRLGGIEERMVIQLGNDIIPGRPEADIERSTPEGKTSAVHFLHFAFTPDQIARFRDPAQPAMAGITHPGYGHMAILPETVRQALAADFD